MDLYEKEENYLFISPKSCFITLSFTPSVTPTMYVHVIDERLRCSLCYRRSFRKSNSLILIPIGNGCQIQRQIIIRTMLYRSFNTLLKEDGISYEEAVNMGTSQPADIIIHTRIPEIRMRECLFRAPGSIEEIFRTRSYQ